MMDDAYVGALSRTEAADYVRSAILAAPETGLLSETATGVGPVEPSRYTILVPLRDGGALAYHSASQAFARWDAQDMAIWDQISNGAFTVDNPAVLPFAQGGFAVASGHDERAALRQRYEAARFDPSSMVLTIAPTMGCNFACAYCFQGLDKPTNRMSEAVMDQIVDYVDQKTSTGGVSRIGVAWYGGEPLMYRDGVMTLSDRLIAVCRRNGASYGASMVTNGYFLDAQTARALAARHVDMVQVTLDGAATAHDARRHLLSGKPTYDRILGNLAEAVQTSAMRISIRVNVDATNGPQAIDLLDDLSARGFGHRPNFAVYFAPIEAITTACASCDPDSFAKTDYGALEVDLLTAAFQRGLAGFARPPMFHGTCGAVREHGFVVLPNGDLHKCWDSVHDPDLRVGTLDTIQQTETGASVQSWKQWSPFDNPVCGECPILPTCAGACAFKFVHPEQTSGEAGALPCPSWKFNMAERLFARARQAGIVTDADWDPRRSPTRAEGDVKTGARHNFASMAMAT